MINKVILVGNVGLDPEVRALDSGAKVARLRLATTERYTDRQTNETKELTLWRGLADVVDKYVRKGSQLYIEGSLRTREWTDKDNQKRYATEIVATEMKLLGRRAEGQTAPSAPSVAPVMSAPVAAPAPQPVVASAPVQAPAPAMPADSGDDLPF